MLNIFCNGPIQPVENDAICPEPRHKDACVDKKKLVDLFYEQSKMFAERNNVTLDEIADAQFHASMRVINERAGIENMMVWIDNQTREFRRGLSRSASWSNRRVSKKEE